MEKTLDTLKVNQTAIVKEVRGETNIKRRFLDLGIVSGTQITALFKSPFSDPTAFLIRGSVLALRKNDSKNILIF